MNGIDEQYLIRSFSWDKGNQDSRQKLMELLRANGANAKHFSDEYFNKFYLVHKIGHIILHRHDYDEAAHSAEAEYFSNLFAYKYFEFKKENRYLDELSTRIDALLYLHNANFDFKLPLMNSLYDKYRKDLRTYAAFHFNSYRKCRSVDKNLLAVMQAISRGKMASLNTGIVLRRNLVGIDLVNECLSTVFEMNEEPPAVGLEYRAELSVDTFDLGIFS